MPEQIENSIVEDWYWNEIEYGVPNKSRLRKERENYDREEMEDEEE